MAQLPRLSRLGAPSLWDPASPAPTSGPRPRLWEGQDVLARWTDGLLYLGTIKKVSSTSGLPIALSASGSYCIIFRFAIPGGQCTGGVSGPV